MQTIGSEIQLVNSIKTLRNITNLADHYLRTTTIHKLLLGRLPGSTFRMEILGIWMRREQGTAVRLDAWTTDNHHRLRRSIRLGVGKREPLASPLTTVKILIPSSGITTAYSCFRCNLIRIGIRVGAAIAGVSFAASKRPFPSPVLHCGPSVFNASTWRFYPRLDSCPRSMSPSQLRKKRICPQSLL